VGALCGGATPEDDVPLDTEAPDEDVFPCPGVTALPVGVEEWPGNAWLTYAANAATAATDAIATPFVIERERSRAASRTRRAARVGSVRGGRGEDPCPAALEAIDSRVWRQADAGMKPV
jgi:hypothetical protein